MAAAQRLATATSIDLAVARSHASNRTKAQMPVQRTITIGNAGTRGLRTYVQLFTVIAMANDVKCDVASNSTFVYAYGFGEDIDASHALYASLVMQMVRASEAYIASGTTGRRRRSPRASTSSWRSVRASASGCPKPAKRRSGKPPDHAGAESRAPLSRCGTRRSSSRTSTSRPRRRGARGDQPVRRRGIRRRRDARVIAQAARRGWAAAGSCPVPARPWRRERSETPSGPRSTPQRNSSGHCSTGRLSTATGWSTSSGRS